MPYFFIRSLENALEPSKIAAFFLGPNTRSPFSSSTSTMPPAKGSSGPTTTRSKASFFAKSAIFSKSITPISTHFATSAMPAFPGAQYNSSTFGLLDNFQQMACSLPPPPITNTFISSLLNQAIGDLIYRLRKNDPLSLFHNTSLQYLGRIPKPYLYCLLQ